MEEKELLTKTDAAEFFGVTRQTIRAWQLQGFGPKFVKTPGGREYTTRKSCIDFCDQLTNQ